MHLRPFSLLLLLAATSIGCAAPDRRKSELPLEVDSDLFAGSVWTGARAEPEPDVSGTPWWLRLRIAYVNRAPQSGSEHLATWLDQVFVERAGRPLATRSVLAQGVLEIRGEGDVSGIERRSPVWEGTTARWRLAPRRDDADPPRVPWRVAEIELARPKESGASPELALVFEGGVFPRAEEEAPEDRANPPVVPIVQREHVVLPPAALEEGRTRRFFVPAPRRLSPQGGFAIEIARIAPPAAGESADALEAGRSALARSVAAAREGTSPITPEESFHFESGTAFPALEKPALQRPALVFLAQLARAPLAGDLALDLEPDALASFVASLGPVIRGRASSESKELPALGWSLERAAYAWLAATALDEKHPLPKELEALLVTHAGELGRFPDLLRDAVLECDGFAALEQRLVQENTLLLEDADPSARLRSFEWLHDRGAAPDGFDPLGPLAERRAALDRVHEAAAQREGAQQETAPKEGEPR